MVDSAVEQRYQKLCEAIAPCGGVAVAFSGGVDSSLLLHAARSALGERVVAFQMVSSLHTPAEQQRAADFAAHCSCSLVRFPFNPLEWPEFVANPANRCYLCKKKIYSLFLPHLAKHGATLLMDGTNADDLHEDRPGLVALRELGVATPLADLGLTKQEVRACAKVMGLHVWNTPSSSCLATRIQAGLAITSERIDGIASVEEFLSGVGFSSCRARLGARDELTIEVIAEDHSRLLPLLQDPNFRKMTHQKGFRAISSAIRRPR